ncbi:membrane fusion protein Use1-domain-containing protein [Hyaloraphidium curvatum]|nr:membrane fusion protein Use1-domain-containing protein [Hyaloraphidium curvatum]
MRASPSLSSVRIESRLALRDSLYSSMRTRSGRRAWHRDHADTQTARSHARRRGGPEAAPFPAFLDHVRKLIKELENTEPRPPLLQTYVEEMSRVESVLESRKAIWVPETPEVRRRHDVDRKRKLASLGHPAQSLASADGGKERRDQPKPALRNVRLSAAEARRASREAILAHHRQTQDALANDLVSMAQALKTNALNFGQLMERDRKVIEEADTLLTANLSKTQQEGSRLKALNSSTRWTTLYSWLVIIFVSIVFAGTYTFIRIT